MNPGPPDQSVSTSESSGVGRGRGHETPDCPGARAGRTRGGARSGAAPAPAESEPRGGGGLLAAPAPPSPPPPPLPPAPRSARMARAAPGNGGARERPGRRRRVPASRLPIPGTAHRVASQFQVRIAAAGAPPFGLAWSLGIPAGGGEIRGRLHFPVEPPTPATQVGPGCDHRVIYPPPHLPSPFQVLGRDAWMDLGQRPGRSPFPSTLALRMGLGFG